MKKHTVRRYSLYTVLGILLILVLILMIGAVDAANRGSGFLFISSFTPSATNTATPTDTPTATLTEIPTETPTNTPVPDTPTATLTNTPTATPTATATPLPTFDETAFVETFFMNVTETAEAVALMQTPSATPVIPDRDLRTGLKMVNPGDGAILFYVKTNRRSGHLGFWIRWNEVTNAEYRLCVEEGACKRPMAFRCAGISNYYSSEEYRSFPVVNVTRRQAADYCSWAGMELMSQKDWKAASEAMGFDDTNTDMIGHMPQNNSASNIIGNVWEWTKDLTDSGTAIIVGGSWKTAASDIRMKRAGGMLPEKYAEDLGFRCVRYIK